MHKKKIVVSYMQERYRLIKQVFLYTNQDTTLMRLIMSCQTTFFSYRNRLNKTAITIIACTFFMTYHTNTFTRVSDIIKNSTTLMTRALSTVCTKAKIVACQRPVTVTSSIAIGGCCTYGIYRLLYWYLHKTDKQLYQLAKRYYDKTNQRYGSMLEHLNKADTNLITRLTSTKAEPDETSLEQLATSNRHKSWPHLQKTIKKFSSYARQLEQRADAIEKNNNATLQDKILKIDMDFLKKNMTKQLYQMSNLQKILKIHQPYFVLYNLLSDLKNIFNDSPNLPKDFEQDHQGTFDYLTYVSKIQRERISLKAARIKAFGRYNTLCQQADTLDENWEQRIAPIISTQTYQDQKKKYLRDKRWAGLQTAVWVKQTFVP